MSSTPPPPTGPPALPQPSEVTQAIEGLQEELALTNDLFRRRLLAGRDTQRAVEQLQTELELQRKTAEGRHLQPLLYDLMLILDRVDRESVVDPLTRSVATELTVVLEKYGMRRIEVHSDAFDAGLQEAVGTIPTQEPEQVGRVAGVIRHGFTMDGRLVRPQQVRVFAEA